jgi:hypothetical protein
VARQVVVGARALFGLVLLLRHTPVALLVLRQEVAVQRRIHPRPRMG